MSARPAAVRLEHVSKAFDARAVLRDVSAARRLDELRDEFLSTAAHEFRTPLAVVKAYAQLMGKRGQGDPKALEVVARQIDRMTRMLAWFDDHLSP